jgi:hypothetical protein
MKAYIGVDNGITGSLSYVDGDNSYMVPTPTFKEQDYTVKKANITRIDFETLKNILLEWMDGVDSVLVLMERPYKNPKGFVASISAARAWEATLILVEQLNLPHEFIDSRKWQKPLLPKGIEGVAALKSASKDIGLRLFPNLRKVIVKQKDADSLLIAEWARRARL